MSDRLLQNQPPSPKLIHITLYVILGACFTTVAMLHGMDALVGRTRLAVAWIVLTALFALVSMWLVKAVLAPNLRKLLVWQRWLVVLIIAGAGGFTLWQHPLTFSSWDCCIIVGAGVPTLVVGGTLLLTLLLVVIGIEEDAPHRFFITAGLLVAYLVAGAAIYQDYGISSDERAQRRHGQVALATLAPDRFGYLSDVPLAEYDLRFNGVAQHVPIVLLEELNELDFRQVWHQRHYLTFLYSALGAFALFRLARESYDDWRLGVVASVLFVLSPRLFAESFYNIKDLVFASAFAIALYFGFRYWRDKTLTFALLFAMTLAFATSVRIIGLGLLFLVIGVQVLDWIIDEDSRSQTTTLSIPLTIFAFMVAYIVLTPAAYGNPIGYTVEAFTAASNYQRWDGEIMYLGLWMRGVDPPWHYALVWMTITVPIWTILLAAAGSVAILSDVVRLRLRLLRSVAREPLLYLGLLFVPLAAVILQNSTLYNGWRQLYFLFVPVVLIATYGLRAVYRTGACLIRSETGLQAFQIGVTILFIGTQLNMLRWMVVNHPHQNVYFNPIVELEAFGGREDFERDYWRLSTKQALEYLLAENPDCKLIVAPSIEVNDALAVMDYQANRRVTSADLGDPDVDYYLEVYRYPVEEVERLPEVHSIIVDGLPILTIHTVE